MLEIALAHGCQLSRQWKYNWTLEIMQISLAYATTYRQEDNSIDGTAHDGRQSG